jgi:DMSO/TMAO reductase YedYZ molybdopterin-dependent catalytic subunit
MGGAVGSPTVYGFESLTDLPTGTRRQDFHRVAGRSRFDDAFTDVPFPTLADRVGVDGDAVRVSFHAVDGYRTDLPLEDCRRRSTLLAWKLDGDPLPPEHGGPVRVVTPHRYACKGPKRATGVGFPTEPEPDTGSSGGTPTARTPAARSATRRPAVPGSHRPPPPRRSCPVGIATGGGRREGQPQGTGDPPSAG